MIPAGKSLKVLHFAPEKILTQLFRSYTSIDYLSADLNPAKAMVKQDITGTTFNDNAFDIIFCAHVLEHIPDDGKAMRELRRILKPDGFAILQVPIKDHFNGRDITTTYEDFSITDPRNASALSASTTMCVFMAATLKTAWRRPALPCAQINSWIRSAPKKCNATHSCPRSPPLPKRKAGSITAPNKDLLFIRKPVVYG